MLRHYVKMAIDKEMRIAILYDIIRKINIILEG